MAAEENQEQVQVAEEQPEDSSTVFLEEEMDFNTLYEESVSQFKEHQIITGKVIEIQKDYVTVDIGYKSEGQITTSEFLDENQEINVAVGDEVEVFLEAVEDSNGIVVLSKDKAEKLRVWERVGRIYEEEGTVEGYIASRIKGGLSVDIGIKAFLPGSQVDLRPVRNLDKLIGERFEFKILKFNQKRGNIVLSRRALLEVDREERRKKTLLILEEGVLIKGYVKNITEYGVFIDLGGVDGLLHITDMTWGRIVHPSEMFNIGDEVEVMVLKFDPVEEKVSLGLKQKQKNPWDEVDNRYPASTRVQGKIVSLTDYGAFIELEPGVEGLIHVSEMSWTKKVRHPSKLFSLGQIVEAVVKDLDVDRKRISLSIREAEPNPWETIHINHPVGSLVVGKVRNITDFGIFVGLDEGIDGLVHISDLSWSQRQRKPSAFAKKGDELEVKILHIDANKERLSLGIKQLSDDPWKQVESRIHINDEVNGRVVNVTDFGIFVEVMDGVEGLIHISELDSDVPKDKLEEFYQPGSPITTKVLKVDVDERRLGLSILGAAGTPREAVMENTVLKDALADIVDGNNAAEQVESEPSAEAAPASDDDAPADVEAAPDAEESIVEEAAPDAEEPSASDDDAPADVEAEAKPAEAEPKAKSPRKSRAKKADQEAAAPEAEEAPASDENTGAVVEAEATPAEAESKAPRKSRAKKADADKEGAPAEEEAAPEAEAAGSEEA